MSILRKALPGAAWGDTERRLRVLAEPLNADQAHELARMLNAYRMSLPVAQRPMAPKSVERLEELVGSPVVQALGNRTVSETPWQAVGGGDAT